MLAKVLGWNNNPIEGFLTNEEEKEGSYATRKPHMFSSVIGSRENQMRFWYCLPPLQECLLFFTFLKKNPCIELSSVCRYRGDITFSIIRCKHLCKTLPKLALIVSPTAGCWNWRVMNQSTFQVFYIFLPCICISGMATMWFLVWRSNSAARAPMFSSNCL